MTRKLNLGSAIKSARKAVKAVSKPSKPSKAAKADAAPAADANPMTGLKTSFGVKAATALLTTAANAKAAHDKLSGDMVALCAAIGRANVLRMAHDSAGGKPYGDSPILSLSNGKWSMTSYGAQRYGAFLRQATPAKAKPSK